MTFRRYAPLATLVAFLAIAASAGAATLEVCPAGCTYASIQTAVAAANPGDTVNVAPGTYAEPQVLINKPLTLQGAGQGESIIDGGQTAGLPLAGTVRVETSAGDVTVDGFTIRNAGDSSGTKTALFEKSPASGPTFRFSHLTLEGLGGVGVFDKGLYSYNSFADVIFSDSIVRQTGGNPLTFEQHRGATDVLRNDIAPLSTGSGSAIAYFTYGDVDVVTPQRVRFNQVSTTGIAFSGAFQNLAGFGRFTGPEVTGNSVTGIAIGNGISINDADTSLGGAEGRIKDAVVSGNYVEGVSGGVNGIRLLGAVTGTTLTGNSVEGFQHGIRAQANAGGAPTGTVVRINRIFGNSTAGLLNDGVETIDATHNWWGCNEGPAAADCDGTIGPVDFDPWLVFTAQADSSDIVVGGDSTNVAGLLRRDSEGAFLDNFEFPDGFPVAFSTTLGSVSPATAPLIDTLAYSTLTSGSETGTATVSATFDNEAATTTVEIVEACPATGGDLDGDGQGDVCDIDDDGDGLDDTTEEQIGTDPRKADSDGDSVTDKADACPKTSGTQADGCPVTTTTGGDDRPPTVTLTSPNAGAALGTASATPVAAQVSDDKGVDRVQFLAGGRVICTDTVAPYECAYQPTGADVGKVLILAVATDTAGQTGLNSREVTVGRFAPGALSSSTTPGRDRTRPYTFTTTGRLTLPANVTAAQGCSGEVSVQFKIGTRTISNRRARLGTDCRYRSSVTFRAKRRPTTLRVRARFHGNRVLAPRVGSFRTARLG